MLSIFTRFGANAPALPAGRLLPAPAPLPSLSAAFSRRAALFGAVASTGALAGSAVRAVPVMGNPIAASDADRRLADVAADVCATLDGAAYAFDTVADEDDQNRRLGRANALTLDMVALPAVGLSGVLAKAKAYLDSNSYDVMHLAELADSLAEDLERVCGARPATV